MSKALELELSHFKTAIDRHEIISFDIFDTLLLRNVIAPTDIFRAVAHKYQKYEQQKLPFDFYRERVLAESQARIMYSDQDDITLDQIYTIIEEKFGRTVSEKLRNYELEMEKEFIVHNPFMKQIYEYALTQGKRVIIISDMYLPKNFIIELLRNNGYQDYDEVIVSSEIMKTKHHGTAYTYVKESFDIFEHQWLHIGDNLHADVAKAQEHHIEALHYRKVSERSSALVYETLSESIIKAIEINRLYTKTDLIYWQYFAIEKVAKIYWNLTLWLASELKKTKKDNIFFIARDGYVIYQLYNKLRKQDPSLPEGTYLYASRRAYQFPGMLSSDKEEAITTLLSTNPQFAQQLTIEEVLNTLELDIQKYQHLLELFELEYGTPISVEFDTYEKAKRFLFHIWEDIEQQLLNEKELLYAYFHQLGLDDYDEINIFDIGWRGSIQKAIADITGKKVFGYYFATTQWAHEYVKQNSVGFAGHRGFPKERMEHIAYFHMIYEFIFSAPHGSVINFKKDSIAVVPNLEDVENDEKLYHTILEMQTEALDLADIYLQYYPFMDVCNIEFVLSDIQQMLQHYPAEDLLGFSSLQNSIGFGKSKDIKKYVTIVSLADYHSNKEGILYDIQYNLWPHALLICDRNRFFTRFEIDTLNETIQQFNSKIKMQHKYIMHLKKMIKHNLYGHYTKRLYQKIKNKLR